MEWEVSYKAENVTDHLCRVFLLRHAKYYVQIDGHKSSVTVLWMNVCIMWTIKFMLYFCMCKMQITHLKNKQNPLLCVLHIAILELFSIHAENTGGSLQVSGLSVGLLSRKQYFKIMASPHHFFGGKKELNKLILELVTMALGFEMGTLGKGKLPELQQNPLFGKMK